MQRYSRQREALINLLASVTNHPSAEWLHTQLKAEFPNIGIATVYRNLNMLSSSGQILKLNVGAGKEHYDGNSQNHYHLYCKSCDKIYDMDMEYSTQLDEQAENSTDAQIEYHSLIFYGTCSNCRSKN